MEWWAVRPAETLRRIGSRKGGLGPSFARSNPASSHLAERSEFGFEVLHVSTWRTFPWRRAKKATAAAPASASRGMKGAHQDGQCPAIGILLGGRRRRTGHRYARQIPLSASPWRDTALPVAATVLDTIEDYAPGFKASVLGVAILSPLDLERRFGLVDGDIMHGAMSLDQLWSARPGLGHAAYRGPVPGLYMCGAGTHPGGGVSGIPGHNAAREMLRDRRWPGRWRVRHG
jgi:hypothetical protein